MVSLIITYLKLNFITIKYIIISALIILGYSKCRSSKEKKYLLFSLIGALDIFTTLLDKYVFTSNLELFLINDLLAVGLYFMFFHLIEKPFIIKKTLLSFFGLLLILAGSLFFFDWPKSDISLYSKYGYLNTIEYLLYSLFSGLTCLIICAILLVKMFKIDLFRLNIIFILFGIMSFYIGDIIQAGLGIYFISDINVHFVFTEIFLTLRLFAFSGFITLGLLWKN